MCERIRSIATHTYTHHYRKSSSSSSPVIEKLLTCSVADAMSVPHQSPSESASVILAGAAAAGDSGNVASLGIADSTGVGGVVDGSGVAAFVGVGQRKSVVAAVDAPIGVRGMVTIVGA